MTLIPRRAVLLGLLGALGVLWVVASSWTAGPAQAHAGLLSSDPAAGSVVAEAPDVVTLTFAEPVTLEAPPRLFDHTGRELDVAGDLAGRRVVVDLPALDRGTHVLAWVIASADGHPVAGSLEFSVGAVSPVVAAAPETVAAGGDDAAAWDGAARAATYAAGLVLAGLVLVHGGGAVAPFLRRHVLGAALLAAVGGALTLGMAAAVTLAVGCLLACLRPRPPAVAGAVVALASFLLEGHSRTSLVVLVGDAGHLLAGAAWLGGLVGCAVALRRLAPDDAGPAVARFSVLAGAATALVAVTGTVMAARLLGSWDALTGTAYGRLLLVKVALVLVVLVIAAANRFRLLPALRTLPGVAAARLLRRAVSAEVAVLVLALGVTGFLVRLSPEAGAADASVSRSPDGVTVRVTLGPGRVGPNTVEVAVTGPEGPVTGVSAPRVVMFGSGLELGSGPAATIAPGVFEARQVLPLAGAWEARLAVEVAPDDVRIVSVPVEVTP